MVLKLAVSKNYTENTDKIKIEESKIRELLHDSVMGVLGDDALRYLS
jgi:hypothetical protein